MKVYSRILGTSAIPLLLPNLILAQPPQCPPPDSSAGLAVVTGQVADDATGVPMGFAEIRLQVSGTDRPLVTRSDPLGRFRFCTVPAGSVIITGELADFSAFLGPVSLTPGQTYSVSLPLSSASAGRETGTLMGVVMDAGSREPLEGASVLLPGPRKTAVTNSRGRFTFSSLPSGTLNLKVIRLGYADTLGEVDVPIGKAVYMEVVMATEPIDMDPIRVTAVRRRIELPGLEDFERRYNSGWGKFVLGEEIQRRSPRKLVDVLWETGVDTWNDGRSLRMRRTMCAPIVYLDGQKLTVMPRSGTMSTRTGWIRHSRPGYAYSTAEEEAAAVLDLINPMDVAAVEVYQGPAETPGEYIDSNSQCGVILVWTRRGGVGK